MNLKVDFAAGGIVLVDKKILIVKNKKNHLVGIVQFYDLGI